MTMNATLTQEPRATGPNNDLAKYIAPPVNVFEIKDGYVIQAEMPGVAKDGLEVTVEGSELVIVGRRQPDEVKAQRLHRESHGADYRRVFELDPAIDSSRIEAKVEQGLLTLRLPTSERAKPQKIAVSD